MKPRALRHQAVTRSAPQSEPRKTVKRTTKAPSPDAVNRRLAALSVADMPWLQKDVDLTPPDGGPEVCGAPVYRAPRKRS